jgi:PAS domain S-box-containing protein
VSLVYDVTMATDRRSPGVDPKREIARLSARIAELQARVSEQKRFEEALRDSEGKLRALLECASEGILVADGDGRVALANPKLAAMLGYDREELLGQPMEMLVPDDLRAAHVAHRTRYAVNPHVRPMGRGVELTARRKDGTTFPVEISLSFSETEDGTLFMAFVTDITERKQAEEALHRSEAHARAILEAATEAIVIVDEQGRIVSVNGKTEEMFGYARARLQGESLEMLLPERLRGRHADHRQLYAEDPRIRPMGRGLDLTAQRSDGSEFPVEISLSYIRTDEGLRAFAFITDITERRALERATRQAERLSALGRLSAGLAHEINNPIGIMSSRIELMLMDAESHGLPADTVQDLQVLHRQASRVAAIAKNLLAFARESPRERELVDLNGVLDAVLVLVGKEFSHRNVRLTTDLQSSLPSVLGHGNALQQVALNLLTNAAEAMKAGGDISISTSAIGKQVRLVIADTGPGIEPEELGRIFEPFFTTKPGGTGLGLSVSYGIIQDHNATVDVESSPGRGTRFVLTFPAVGGASAPPDGAA